MAMVTFINAIIGLNMGLAPNVLWNKVGLEVTFLKHLKNYEAFKVSLNFRVLEIKGLSGFKDARDNGT